MVIGQPKRKAASKEETYHQSSQSMVVEDFSDEWVDVALAGAEDSTMSMLDTLMTRPMRPSRRLSLPAQYRKDGESLVQPVNNMQGPNWKLLAS